MKRNIALAILTLILGQFGMSQEVFTLDNDHQHAELSCTDAITQSHQALRTDPWQTNRESLLETAVACAEESSDFKAAFALTEALLADARDARERETVLAH